MTHRGDTRYSPGIMVSATRVKIAKPKASIPAGKKKPVRGYEAALRYLYQHTDYEKMLRVRYNADTFNLDRMNVLLKHLGDPHKRIRTVHIAGTKGKGSTAIMLALGI